MWETIAPGRKKTIYLREALKKFLALPEQTLLARPRLTSNNYSKVSIVITKEQKDAIRRVYKTTPLAVVLQAALLYSIETRAFLTDDRLMVTKTTERFAMKVRMTRREVTQLQQISADPSYRTVRNLIDTILAQFIESRPWQDSTYSNTADALEADELRGNQFWRDFNSSDIPTESCQYSIAPLMDHVVQIRLLATVVDISVAATVRTAIIWWMKIHTDGEAE